MHSMIHTMTATWSPPTTFATRLRDARERLDLTIEQAAARCGLSHSTWSTWERGAKPRDMATVVEKISRGLAQSGVPLDPMWLMWGQSATGDGGDSPNMQPTAPYVASRATMGTIHRNKTTHGSAVGALRASAA